MLENKYVIVIVSILVILGIVIYYQTRTESKFDINVDPLRANEYERVVHGCGNGVESVGYGINKEHYNNITVCDFINKFEKDTVFAQNINQDPCDVVARQMCEVLYQNQQQYFENMWSGIGECEMYQKEKCKECPKGTIKINV